MGMRDDVLPPATKDSLLPPTATDRVSPDCAPTPTTVLNWIAATGDQPWFPSHQASTSDIERDLLDEPLHQLRTAGLVQIATWERGLGQGYRLTEDGNAVIAGKPPTLSARLAGAPRASPVVTTPAPLIPPFNTNPDATQLVVDARPPIVVPILIVANLLWFVVGVVIALRLGIPFWSYLSDGNTLVLHRLGSVSGLDLLRGDWWRLLSSCFVHTNALHLVVNLFALGMIGPLAEMLWGRWRLLVIYGLSGLGGTCLAMALHPDAPLVGASGAIWGILLSLIAWFMLARPYLPPLVAADSIRRLTIVTLLNAGLSFLPGISWEAHLGGGLVGFLTAGLLNGVRVGDRWHRRLGLGLLFLMPILCVAGLVASMGRSEVWAIVRQQFETDNERQARIQRFREMQQTAERLQEAATTFSQEFMPLLDRIKPEVVAPIEKNAIYVLYMPAARRKPETMTELRAQINGLKSTADEIVQKLSGPPTGIEGIDQVRTNASEFAASRSQSLGLLLDMLASDTSPDEDTWSRWGEARRTTTARWKKIFGK